MEGNTTANDDLRVMQKSTRKLEDLAKKKKNINRAIKDEIDKINLILNRLYEQRNVKEKMKEENDLSSTLHQIRELISKLRTLI